MRVCLHTSPGLVLIQPLLQFDGKKMWQVLRFDMINSDRIFVGKFDEFKSYDKNEYHQFFKHQST